MGTYFTMMWVVDYYIVLRNNNRHNINIVESGIKHHNPNPRNYNGKFYQGPSCKMSINKDNTRPKGNNSF